MNMKEKKYPKDILVLRLVVKALKKKKKKLRVKRKRNGKREFHELGVFDSISLLYFRSMKIMSALKR